MQLFFCLKITIIGGDLKEIKNSLLTIMSIDLIPALYGGNYK